MNRQPASNLMFFSTPFLAGVMVKFITFSMKLLCVKGFSLIKFPPTCYLQFTLLVRGRFPSYSKRLLANVFRYITHPGGYHAAVRLSKDYASRARAEVDIDDPSVECLQALLLLAVAFIAAGKGKKAYMMLGG